MKRLKLIFLTALGVCVSSACMASLASAEVHLWLISGADVLTLTSTESSGEFLFEDTKTALGAIDILCSFVLDGSVGPEGEDEITEVLTLAGVQVTLANQLLCISDSSACTEPLFSPINLPWLTQLELMTTGTFETLDTITTTTAGKPGFAETCKTIVGNQTDECTGNSSVGIENMAGEGDVLAIFNTTNGTSEKDNCTMGGTAGGEIVGEFLLSALEGLTLAVSTP